MKTSKVIRQAFRVKLGSLYRGLTLRSNASCANTASDKTQNALGLRQCVQLRAHAAQIIPGGGCRREDIIC